VKRVEIDDEADAELIEAAYYYNSRRKGLGLDFLNAIQSALSLIATDPLRHASDRFGSRRYVMTRFPFAIHYLDFPEHVRVIAFAHTSRDPGYWRHRMEEEEE
jgi:toxin ParE1/3/4